MSATTRSPSPTASATEEEMSVPTAVGDLRGVVHVPADTDRAVGMVLVDGSGVGDVDSWGGRPAWLGEVGAVTLRHDKPGCGTSPGDWRRQTLVDRAHETVAAVRALRDHVAVEGRPVGLYGVSQGGWVAVLAAALAPEEIDFVVSHCGPGVSPATQERERLQAVIAELQLPGADTDRGLAWVDRRAELILGAGPVEDILAEQRTLAGEPWSAVVAAYYDTAEDLQFIRGILDFDPAAVLPDVRCPVLALFGSADTVVPPASSLRVLADHLPPDPRHGVAVFPHADHGLFVAERDEAVPRRDQIAPAYQATVAAFLADRADEGGSSAS